mgnify:CR=1 FL=1
MKICLIWVLESNDQQAVAVAKEQYQDELLDLEETDENEIIALAILRMQLPTDMAAVATVRLQEMVGLCHPNEFSASEAEPSQRAAEEAVSALADGDDQDDGDYISAHAMTPGLAQRLGMRPDHAQS